MMRPWSAAEVRLLPGRPVFFSPRRHLVVESVIASGEGKPNKMGSTKSVSWATRSTVTTRLTEVPRLSEENTAASHLLLDRSASYCLVSMSEVYHCSSQQATHFKRKVSDNLIPYFAQISMFSQPHSLLSSHIMQTILPMFSSIVCLSPVNTHLYFFCLPHIQKTWAWNRQFWKPALCDVTKDCLPYKFSKGNDTRCPPPFTLLSLLKQVEIQTSWSGIYQEAKLRIIPGSSEIKNKCLFDGWL